MVLPSLLSKALYHRAIYIIYVWVKYPYYPSFGQNKPVSNDGKGEKNGKEHKSLNGRRASGPREET